MASENHSCGKGHGPPFMRVYGDRIGSFKAVDQIAMIVGKDCRRAVSAVDMKPKIGLATDF
jgi:hypothetical protein